MIVEKYILGITVLIFGFSMFYLAFKLMVFSTILDKVITVDDVVYCFKIMEIIPSGNSVYLKSIDSITIKLNGDDFNFHSPEVNNIFIMLKDGRILIKKSFAE